MQLNNQHKPDVDDAFVRQSRQADVFELLPTAAEGQQLATEWLLDRPKVAEDLSV